MKKNMQQPYANNLADGVNQSDLTFSENKNDAFGEVRKVVTTLKFLDDD